VVEVGRCWYFLLLRCRGGRLCLVRLLLCYAIFEGFHVRLTCPPIFLFVHAVLFPHQQPHKHPHQGRQRFAHPISSLTNHAVNAASRKAKSDRQTSRVLARSALQTYARNMYHDHMCHGECKKTVTLSKFLPQDSFPCRLRDKRLTVAVAAYAGDQDGDSVDLLDCKQQLLHLIA
jgi:hypothetical protein